MFLADGGGGVDIEVATFVVDVHAALGFALGEVFRVWVCTEFIMRGRAHGIVLLGYYVLILAGSLKVVEMEGPDMDL